MARNCVAHGPLALAATLICLLVLIIKMDTIEAKEEPWPHVRCGYDIFDLYIKSKKDWPRSCCELVPSLKKEKCEKTDRPRPVGAILEVEKFYGGVWGKCISQQIDSLVAIPKVCCRKFPAFKEKCDQKRTKLLLVTDVLRGSIHKYAPYDLSASA